MFNQKIFDSEIAKGENFHCAFERAIEDFRKQTYNQYTKEAVIRRKNELCEAAAEAYALWLLEEFKEGVKFEDFEDFLLHAKEDIYYLRDVIRKQV